MARFAQNKKNPLKLLEELDEDVNEVELALNCEELEYELSKLKVKEKLGRALKYAETHCLSIFESIFHAVFACLLCSGHLLLTHPEVEESERESAKKKIKSAISDLVFTLSTLMDLTIERENLNQLGKNEELVNGMFDPSSMPHILILEGLDATSLEFQRSIHEKLSHYSKHIYKKGDAEHPREDIFLCIVIVHSVSNLYFPLRENFIFCYPLYRRVANDSQRESVMITETVGRYITMDQKSGTLAFPLRLLKILRRRHVPAVHIGLDLMQLIRQIINTFQTDPRIWRCNCVYVYDAYISAVKAVCALSGRGYVTFDDVMVIFADMMIHRIEVKEKIRKSTKAEDIVLDIANSFDSVI